MTPFEYCHQQMRTAFLISRFQGMPQTMLFLGVHQVVVDKIP